MMAWLLHLNKFQLSQQEGGVSLSNTMIVFDDEDDHDTTVEVPHCKIACKCCQSKKKKQHTATICPTQVKEEYRNWDHIQQCLAWKPMDVCEKTLKATTQYTQNKLLHYVGR